MGSVRRRRKFDLPAEESIQKETAAGVAEVVQMLDQEDKYGSDNFETYCAENTVMWCKTLSYRDRTTDQWLCGTKPIRSIHGREIKKWETPVLVSGE
ncbi:hypothetical protein CK203_069861 [Vitis vinifera]|nr:hypothetical protein CK203_069861 [Vitis vinifera]